MPFSCHPPGYWGNKIPEHWSEKSLYTWMLSDNELKTITSSQCGQDVLVDALARMISNENTFYYLDIGANDGFEGSSTILLERNGWKGLLVEPNPILFSSIRSNRKDPIIPVAVASKTSISTLYTSGNSHKLGTLELSSSGYQRRRLQLNIEADINDKEVRMPVPTLPLIHILDYFYTIYKFQPHFLKVDAEGAEMDIVKMLVNSGIRPLILEIENNSREEIIGRILRDYGYQCTVIMDSFVEIWSLSEQLKKHSIDSKRLGKLLYDLSIRCL